MFHAHGIAAAAVRCEFRAQLPEPALPAEAARRSGEARAFQRLADRPRGSVAR
jgi:hypothetical protein